MKIVLKHAGKKKIETNLEGHRILTDVSLEYGGEGTAPSPFSMFLASLGQCAALFAYSYCMGRNISTEGITVEEDIESDPSNHLKLKKITINIKVPNSFPEEHVDGILNAVNYCPVKKAIASAPTIETKLIKD